MKGSRMLNHNDDEYRFMKLIESLPAIAVQGYNSQREVIYWNNASASLYGYEKNEALGKKLEDLIIPEKMRQGVIDAHKKWIDDNIEIPAAELQLKHKSGGLVPVFSSHVLLKQETKDPEMFCVDLDLSEQYKAAEKLKILANHDALTDLPNRRYFENELESKIKEASNLNQKFYVFFIDLDNFKVINDTMGHNAGDKLLQRVSNRLISQLKKCDLICRFGGDEFVAVIPYKEKKEDIEFIAKKLISSFDLTFCLEDQDVYLTASLGISVFPENGKTVSELLKNADAAMYQAKEYGKNCFQFYTASIHDTLQRHRDIITKLHQSLQNNHFHLVYQPKINFSSSKIQSCEALIRWNPDEYGNTISPTEFIPIAERSDLIIRLGHWVMTEACRQLKQWRTLGFDDIRVDINVSGMQIIQNNFFDIFDGLLREHELKQGDIGIELTEHALIFTEDIVLKKLHALKESGVNISIDDFGTGYSSLSYLKDFPVETLKIDRSFIKDIPHDQKDMSIMEAIVQVGHKLGLTIVVEGVETTEQKKFCQSLQCDLAQGYLFYKPMPANKLTHLLMEKHDG